MLRLLAAWHGSMIASVSCFEGHMLRKHCNLERLSP